MWNRVVEADRNGEPIDPIDLSEHDLRRTLSRRDYDHELTGRGWDQVRRAAEALERALDDTPVLWYTSPMTRALQTASHLSTWTGSSRPSDARWAVDDRIIERDFGDFGRTRPANRERLFPGHPDVKDMRYGSGHHYCPRGGESAAALVARVRSFLSDVTQDANDAAGPIDVVVVAHGEVIWAVRHLLERRPFLTPLPSSDHFVPFTNGSIAVWNMRNVGARSTSVHYRRVWIESDGSPDWLTCDTIGSEALSPHEIAAALRERFSQEMTIGAAGPEDSDADDVDAEWD